MSDGITGEDGHATMSHEAGKPLTGAEVGATDAPVGESGGGYKC